MLFLTPRAVFLGSQTVLQFERSWGNTGFDLLNKAEDVSCTAKGQREPRATLAVGVNNPAERAILLPPQLALDPDIHPAHGPETLYDGGVRIKLCVLEAGHKAVAPSRHPAHLRAV